jgi:hypothetical protein
MAHTLEIPEPLYRSLTAAAEKSGKTPLEWLAAQLGKSRVAHHPDSRAPEEGVTLADRMKGRLGRIHSGGGDLLSEAGGEAFTDELVQKREEGRL